MSDLIREDKLRTEVINGLARHHCLEDKLIHSIIHAGEGELRDYAAMLFNMDGSMEEHKSEIRESIRAHILKNQQDSE